VTDLAARIRNTAVKQGQLSAWWLGGSGFVFKAPDGSVLYVDPYLSNCVKEMFGAGRAFPPPIHAADVRADAVISTHWHEDHLDPASIPVIAANDARTRFIMPPSAVSHAIHIGVPRTRIESLATGEKINVGEFTVVHVPARHEAGIPGWEVPDAMGLILEAQGLRVYISGDTEYDARLRNLKKQKLDVGIFCINGVTGNMDAHEAALLAWQLRVSIAIPMHHHLWDINHEDATLDPALMQQSYRRLGGAGDVIVPELSAEIILK
jgi:L-ascorbate metabolism protein UlaG (beta-lactamase superfamily)